MVTCLTHGDGIGGWRGWGAGCKGWGVGGAKCVGKRRKFKHFVFKNWLMNAGAFLL